MTLEAAYGQIAIVNPTVPNPGDFIFTATSPTTGALETTRFNFEGLDLDLAPLNPTGLAQRYPQIVQPTNGFNAYYGAAFNVLGVPLQLESRSGLGYNSTELSLICLPRPDANDTEPLSFDPQTGLGIGVHSRNDHQFYIWQSGSYADSFQGYLDFIAGRDNASANFFDSLDAPASGQAFRSAIYGCSVANGYENPVVGSPISQQFQLVTDGLDLAAADTPTPNLSGELDESSWGVGVWTGPVSSSRQDGFELSARVAKSWRAFEGGRSLVSIDAPVTFQRMGGRKTYKGSLAVSLTHMMSRRWSLEPRIAWGYTNAPDDNLKGQVVAATLASRLTFDSLGRGTLTMGNMLGYSKVVGVRFMDRKVDGSDTENWTLLNGFAYDLPLKVRATGRSMSLRGSYMFAHMFGDDLYTRNVHLVSASLGIRLRDTTVRNRADLLRIGFNGKFAKGYSAAYAFVGYRF
ncbi:MAG: hypothetical protein ABW039_14555 [Sphingobium sp.]